MHYYAGISVTWEDLGGCCVFVRSLIIGTKKALKIYMDLKSILQKIISHSSLGVGILLNPVCQQRLGAVSYVQELLRDAYVLLPII